MTRLVLLVVDYLCHVIVHFSCMNERGAGPNWAPLRGEAMGRDQMCKG
jgi:hypothetical protein